jgi:hypothetical protein
VKTRVILVAGVLAPPPLCFPGATRFANDKWTQVVWEIEPLARDRVTLLEIGYWVNKMLAAPGNSVVVEIDRIQLQRVIPDPCGWSVKTLVFGRLMKPTIGAQRSFQGDTHVRIHEVRIFLRGQ